MRVPAIGDEDDDQLDGWDWEIIKYAGTVILQKSEKDFWNSTPREINALMAVHADVNNPNREKLGYIDEVL
jgi:hypothetical protein